MTPASVTGAGQEQPRTSPGGDWALRSGSAAQGGTRTFRRDGHKLRCTACGRMGYEGGTWMDDCRRGHPFECECGRVFGTLGGIASHRRPCRCGKHHSKTPGQGTNEQGATK